MRETIPVVKRVAASLWHLATGDFYRSTTLTFGIQKSTAVTIKNEFCDVICEISDELIHFPENVQEMRDEILNLSRICDIHQTFCATDGSQIETKLQ